MPEKEIASLTIDVDAQTSKAARGLSKLGATGTK